ncbi:MAG: B12-binding domain-containing radical SAM protein, partial [Clostridiales Family XIII bacterium]|nr:B12-binding domain-containing radical SAM protein [Clostridiales Family XIII bacterium]
MKILFVLPYDTAYRYKAAFSASISYAPLTLPALAALVPPELCAEITLADEGVCRFDYEAERYDIVGISLVTSSSARGYELARLMKSRGSTVVFGGHHASLMPAEAREHGDAVFIGAAEETLPRFFRDFAQGKVKPFYDACGVFPDRIPWPRRDLLPRRGYLPQPTVIANYGCGYGCAYCVIHDFWGCRAKRPIGDVIAEIAALGKREILFMDPSPLSDISYAKELYAELAKLNIRWAGLAGLNAADDEELLELIRRSGCVGLLLGFESFRQADLDAMNKAQNKTARYKEIVSRLHDRRISVLGTFMLGLDGDTKAEIERMPELIAETKIDIPRYAILTPYPGTPLYRGLEAEGRILTRDWSKYDGLHCVFEPKQISARELESAFLTLWKKTYDPGSVLRRLRYPSSKRLTALAANIGFHIYANRLRG